MAHAESLADEELESIARQIGVRIQRLAALSNGVNANWIINLKRLLDQDVAQGTPLFLCESFPHWRLDPMLLKQAVTDEDIRVLSHFTGRWHHQIRRPSGKMAYARSMRIGNELDSDQWSVREIFDGELAQKLDAVYDLIDRQFSDDFVVRLLSIRSYQLNALWILNPHTGEQNVVVVTTSDASNAIQTGIVYSSREFLRILRTMSIVQGIEGVREQPNFNPFLSSNSHGGWTIEIAIHFHLRYAAKN